MRIFQFNPPKSLFIAGIISIVFLFTLIAIPGNQQMEISREILQKPTSPAEGEIVKVNPPPFIWHPIKDAKEYVLQISTSATFPIDSTYTYPNIRIPVFVPSQPLAIGKWYWRIAAPVNDEISFNSPSSFEIPSIARTFPFPVWNEVIPNITHSRPRLFFPSPLLNRYRGLAQNELKPIIDDLISSCNAEINRALPEEPGKRPKGPAFGPWALKVMNDTREPMDYMEKCALVYLLTQNKQIGEEARRRIIHFFSWDPNGSTGFFAYDEPSMWMMMRGIRAYDWTYDLFTPDERQNVENCMKIRANQFLERLQQLPFESNPYNSHVGRLPGFLGECALSFIHEWPQARQWLHYATLLYYTSFPAWGGDDGGWQEGPHYWTSYMDFALHFVIALRHAANIDLMQKPFFRNTPYYALYTFPPYRQHSPFGDGQTENAFSAANVMYAFSTLLRDPYIRWYAEKSHVIPGNELLTLSTYDPGIHAVSPLELPQSRFFPNAGLVSFHTALGDKEKDIHFLFRSSPYGSNSHGHADQNAFIIEAFGKGLAIATGYYPWYNSPHHDSWTRSTQAVNSILVNGQGQVQQSWQATGQITQFISGKVYDYAEGDAAQANGGTLKKFLRHVVHIKPQVFILFDDLEAVSPSNFQWLLHALNPIEINKKKHTLQINNSPAAMKVLFLLPHKVDFDLTNKYTCPPELPPGDWSDTWHLSAQTKTQSINANFLAVLMVYPKGEEQTLPKAKLIKSDGAVTVSITFPDGKRQLVIFRTSSNPKTIKFPHLETTARVFAQGFDKNGIALKEETFSIK